MHPYLQEVNNKVRGPVLNIGTGINNGNPAFDIKPEFSSEESNLDSRKLPALHVREPRTSFTTALSGTPYSLSRSVARITSVDGTSWDYWNGTAWVNIDTLTASADACQVNFATYTILVNGTDEFDWDGTTTTTSLTDMPAGMTRLAVHANRVYAVSSSDYLLYYSALGDHTDWTTANDAGDITIETANGENSVTVHTYSDHIIYFKEHSLHELFGTGPTNYTMQTLSDRIGCVAPRTVKEVQGYLFWLGEEGVYIYSGGTSPQLLSYPWIQDYIDDIDWTNIADACAGTDGDRYYLCLPVGSNARINLTYDVNNSVWHVEDTTNFVEFVEFDGDLYGMGSDKQIKKMISTAGETINWTWTSKKFLNSYLSNKHTIHSLYALVDLPTGSELKCAIKSENGSFTDVKTFTASASVQNQMIYVPITVAFASNWYQIKFYGTGPCTIYRIELGQRIRGDSYNA